MALFQERGLEVCQYGKTSPVREDFAVKNQVVPKSTGYLEIDIFDEASKHPVSEEEGRLDLKRDKVRVQLGKHLAEVLVE